MKCGQRFRIHAAGEFERVQHVADVVVGLEFGGRQPLPIPHHAGKKRLAL